MRAAGGLDGNFREAVGAFFGRRLGRWRFLFPLESVDGADEKKDDKGDYDKADERADEKAIVEGDSANLLGLSQGEVGGRGRALFQDDKEIGEINVPQQQADRRHDHIGNQRFDDGAKGGADDDPNSHVHHVAPHDKLFEFFPHFYLSLNLNLIIQLVPPEGGEPGSERLPTGFYHKSQEYTINPVKRFVGRFGKSPHKLVNWRLRSASIHV